MPSIYKNNTAASLCYKTKRHSATLCTFDGRIIINYILKPSAFKQYNPLFTGTNHVLISAANPTAFPVFTVITINLADNAHKEEHKLVSASKIHYEYMDVAFSSKIFGNTSVVGRFG